MIQSTKPQSKWISDLTADTPVGDAARRVLTFRLEAVRDCLGQALRDDEQLADRIHELRVATRRASAALEVFAECLPAKVYKAARRQLRDLRRAAGEARDWDVLISELMKEVEDQPAEDRAGADMLIGYAMAHRIPAQTRLELCSPNYPFGFERFMAETVGAIRYKGAGKSTLLNFVQPNLAAMLDGLNQTAGNERGDDYEQLHDTRIAGKRLRYAMEIFVDCFGPALRKQICPALAKLQQVLGEVNDHFTAVQRFALLNEKLRAYLPQCHERYNRQIHRMIKHHESEMPVGRRRFHEWREQWQRPEIQMAIAEICYLTPPVCRHDFGGIDARTEGPPAERIA